MTWNHRVVLRDGWYSIREAYYDDPGNPMPLRQPKEFRWERRRKSCGKSLK